MLSLPMTLTFILFSNMSFLYLILLNSLLNMPNRKSFSVFALLKFSVEKEYNVSSFMPSSLHHSSSCSSFLMPNSWPFHGFKPIFLPYLRLPSRITAIRSEEHTSELQSQFH